MDVNHVVLDLQTYECLQARIKALEAKVCELSKVLAECFVVTKDFDGAPKLTTAVPTAMIQHIDKQLEEQFGDGYALRPEYLNQDIYGAFEILEKEDSTWEDFQ